MDQLTREQCLKFLIMDTLKNTDDDEFDVFLATVEYHIRWYKNELKPPAYEAN